MALPLIMAGLAILGSMSGSSSEAEQLENQAIALEFQATETILQGRAKATSIRGQEEAVMGATKSAASGSGVQVDTGSVLDVMEQNAFSIELDARTVESNASRAAEGLRKGAKSARLAKPTGMTTLLGAFGSGASGYAAGQSING